jgi:hypothetical protein
MAVQSEIQLISKFGSREDWQQISVNIAQKFAFKSTYFGGDHLLSFYVETALLETFEYAKEHDANKLRAIPLFLYKEDFDAVELEYQHEILKLKEIEKDEILFYDVTHFENEREVVLIDTKTQKKRYRKIFTEFQDVVIQRLLEPYLVFTIEEVIEELQEKDEKNIEKYKTMYHEYDCMSSYKIKQKFVANLDGYDEAFTLLYLLAKEDDTFDMGDRVYDIFHALASDEYDDVLFINDDYEGGPEMLPITTVGNEVIKSITSLLEDRGIYIIENGNKLSLYIMDYYDIVAVYAILGEMK